MAARGAGAAARAHAAHRRAHEPVAADDPEGHGRAAAFARVCRSWAGPTAAMCGSTIAGRRDADACASMRRNWSRSRRTLLWPAATAHGGRATGDPHRTDRVRAGHRSGRRRLRRKPGAPGRQRHRLHHIRIWHQREMAGAAQRVAPAHDARGRPSRSYVAGIGQLAAIQSVAPSLGVELRPIDVRDAGEIERAHHRHSRAQPMAV